jgi:RNA polymerase sigma factor (sigma-70 family)
VKKAKLMTNRTNRTARPLENLVEQAKAGDKQVLEEIVRRIQDKIYGLAIRMLYVPADAQDATQEILVKVITHLATFKGESSFETWVYSIAANHLLSMRKSRAERWEVTFDHCVHMIEEGGHDAADESSATGEQNLIVEETKLACVHYLLLCLKREMRLAVIMGEIFGISNAEGARILGLTQAAYRQRLSRGRRQLLHFLSNYCGLVDADNPCHCKTLASLHVKKRHIDPRNLFFAVHPRQEGPAREILQELDRMTKAAMLLRNHPDYQAPGVFVEYMKRVIDSGTLKLLS